MIGFGETTVRCSASGCTEAAQWRVNWRNPRIHAADRVKVWLACDAHRGTLDEYLTTRGFPTLVTARDDVPELVPDRA
ncbi:hypothetical protein [uncultured Schumannella sp.]|uniref:hypothetical protein n=1 Tax=uncultured Schumannella sp. TaxID=1195956 RepID=UPI0025CBED95|nr:hypothetical protein [uncultured Schumannella sp.]